MQQFLNIFCHNIWGVFILDRFIFIKTNSAISVQLIWKSVNAAIRTLVCTKQVESLIKWKFIEHICIHFFVGSNHIHGKSNSDMQTNKLGKDLSTVFQM